MPNGKTVVTTTAVQNSHKEVELKSVTFSELWNNYAHGNPYDDPNGQYKNQCAIRMSVTLHKVGIAMKSFSRKRVRPMPGKPTLGRLLLAGKPTATRAYEFAEWLKLRPIAGVLAPENITGPNLASKVSGRTGIIFFDGYWLQDGDSPDNLSGGHVDLWNGSKLTGFGSGVRISWNIVLPGIWSDFRNSKTILFFSRQMKLVTVVVGALVGGALATMICWGALYVYGAFVLRGEGSLFDTNPEIANLFFLGWGGLIAIFATAGAIIVTRRKSARYPTK